MKNKFLFILILLTGSALAYADYQLNFSDSIRNCAQYSQRENFMNYQMVLGKKDGKCEFRTCAPLKPCLRCSLPLNRLEDVARYYENPPNTEFARTGRFNPFDANPDDLMQRLIYQGICIPCDSAGTPTFIKMQGGATWK